MSFADYTLRMNTDPELHSQYHLIAEQEANIMLDYVLPCMAFDEEDIVMDIGCGSGDITADVILPKIPKVKKIIGVDIIPKMIEFAKTYKASEKIEYHVADIEHWCSLKTWEGTVSKAFSSFCFHWLKDQKRGFQCLYDLLKPKGEAAFSFLLSAAIWDCHPFMISDSKWKTFLQDADPHVPDSHHLNHGAKYYEKMLTDLGFEVLACVEENKTYEYKVSAVLRISIGLFSALTYHIPEELKDEFLDDFLAVYRKLHGENLEYNYRTLRVHIRKP